MKNRFRIEIYDEVKSNDITIYSEHGMNRENLSELIYFNINKFDGNIKAYVYDMLNKRKITAAFIPMEITQSIKVKTKALI